MTCDQRWLPMDQMATRAEAKAGAELYQGWHGTPRADPHQDGRGLGRDAELNCLSTTTSFILPACATATSFSTISRRAYLEQIDKVLHDLYLSPPHHYLAQYRWIRDVFQADAVMHIGKHGSWSGCRARPWGSRMMLSGSGDHGFAQYLSLHHQRSRRGHPRPSGAPTAASSTISPPPSPMPISTTTWPSCKTWWPTTALPVLKIRPRWRFCGQ